MNMEVKHVSQYNRPGSSWAPLDGDIQYHLIQIYKLLTTALFYAFLGSLTHLYTGFLQGGLLSALISMGCLFYL